MSGLDYLIAKLPTAATIAVIVAFVSTLTTRQMPLDLGDILFFLGVWAALSVIAAVILMVIELIRDRL
ncbi:hypothetical protein QP028_04475 [Corynebacterium suedekumii]|uniref:Uncharacterized protein n=1 Tax=Corynebacterium suedekumii TaxID=3049801 RepID=A0ABY8VPI0_9CORY|nr:hypothetical protein [Corynebacterium suedekumii]WIM71413.1 hypothetical protein QP029_06465 [Corynebacterium suedekumii]WIM72982.1 hypothetical protein QP028_04475 [Corynebacterium suedekumii]